MKCKLQVMQHLTSKLNRLATTAWQQV